MIDKLARSQALTGNADKLHSLHLPTAELSEIPRHLTDDEPNFEFRSLLLQSLQRQMQKQCLLAVHFPTRWNSSSLI
jgi:hypothetical protein